MRKRAKRTPSIHKISKRSPNNLSLSALILSIILIIFLIIYTNYKSQQIRIMPAPVQNIIQISPKPIFTPLPPAPRKAKSLFQKMLTELCKNKHYNLINVDVNTSELPILINTTILKVESAKIECTDPNYFRDIDYETNYAFINFIHDNKKDSVGIYDQYSQEEGHGGYSFLGSVGKIIKDDGTVKLTFYLNGGDVVGSLVGSSGVIIRGEKRLVLNNGEIIFANISVEAIKGNDPRLIDALKPYSRPSEIIPGSLEVYDDGVDNAIKQRFFSNLSNLESPEKENIAYIANTLAAISAK